MNPNLPAPAPANAPPPGPEPFDPEADADRERRKYRSARRKARERAGEIKELNITAMMDMMTIILVFLLKSYTASSVNVQMTDNLTIPRSTTQKNPQENINITIAFNEVLVNDKATAPVSGGVIPADYREGHQASSLMIPQLHAALEKEVEKAKYIAQYNPNAPFEGKVNIIADKRVPYQTIFAVLYTAGRAELGNYKLMAMKNE